MSMIDNSKTLNKERMIANLFSTVATKRILLWFDTIVSLGSPTNATIYALMQSL